jgi:hypothetical protein
MKNIHLLPTDKPSRLIHNDSKQLCYQSNKSFKNDRKNRKKFNIYITSDENPKNKDYYWDENKLKFKRYFESRESFPSLLHRFKVILTTDPNLIKDGVQAIDDEFLEWFVKNPSCEEVPIITVVYLNKSTYRTNIGFEKWRIGTIPKEETKQ